eukprot:8173257-Ditylum_brightwellii.AAC.1
MADEPAGFFCWLVVDDNGRALDDIVCVVDNNDNVCVVDDDDDEVRVVDDEERPVSDSSMKS